MKPTKKKFTEKEDAIILDWVKKNGGIMKKTPKLAEILGRRASSVSERYKNHLTEKKKIKLTEEQKIYILYFEDEHKKKWAKISRKFGVTPSNVKNYYYSQMAKISRNVQKVSLDFQKWFDDIQI
jgi:hypothetical protein